MKNFLTSLGTGILFLILFVAGAFFNEFLTAEKSFNANKSINFSRDIEVSKSITPNLFVSEPNFVATEILANKTSLDTDEKAQISKLFSMIIERAKKDGICVGGSYSVEPRISYKDGAENIVGQRVNAHLTCTITKDKLPLYNELLNDIDSILKTSQFVAVSLPSLRAIVDLSEAQKNEEALYDELLQKSLKLEKHYSQTLGKNCSVSNLNLSPSISRVASLNSMKESTQMDLALPIVKDEIQKASATVVYICK